jgi:purine-nucleoside phosphorylase
MSTENSVILKSNKYILNFKIEICTFSLSMGAMKPLKEAAAFLEKSLTGLCPETAVVLGSGLGQFVTIVSDKKIIETASIPHWPASTVPGHKGRLITGIINKTHIIIQQGRVHFYEGYSIQEIVFPIRVLGMLGIKNLIITNAAGGVHTQFKPGDLMIITDHLNLMFTNPLIGSESDSLGPRFPDMSHPYDEEYIALAEETGRSLGLSIHKGILAASSGPSYETAAEIRMIRTLGGDAVCMSTVPEVIAAVQLGIRILGISCITNMGTGLSKDKLTHEEVRDNACRMNKDLSMLLKKIIVRI